MSDGVEGRGGWPPVQRGWEKVRRRGGASGNKTGIRRSVDVVKREPRPDVETLTVTAARQEVPVKILRLDRPTRGRADSSHRRRSQVERRRDEKQRLISFFFF